MNACFGATSLFVEWRPRSDTRRKAATCSRKGDAGSISTTAVEAAYFLKFCLTFDDSTVRSSAPWRSSSGARYSLRQCDRVAARPAPKFGSRVPRSAFPWFSHCRSEPGAVDEEDGLGHDDSFPGRSVLQAKRTRLSAGSGPPGNWVRPAPRVSAPRSMPKKPSRSTSAPTVARAARSLPE